MRIDVLNDLLAAFAVDQITLAEVWSEIDRDTEDEQPATEAVLAG